MDQTMKVLPIERKGPELHTLERYYIYDITKKGLQMNDTFTNMHNPVFDIIVKTHTHPPNNLTPSPSPSLQPLTVSSLLPHTTGLYINIPTYTDSPQTSNLNQTATASTQGAARTYIIIRKSNIYKYIY
jgi:hypothetical protein